MVSAGFCSCTSLYRHRSKGAGVCKEGVTNRTATAHLETSYTGSRAAAAIAATALVTLSCLNPASAIISAPPCIKGEGPGCEASGAESGLIRELLEKSRANREKNDKAVLEKYWQQGYGDYFAYGYNKELKKGDDGKWRLEEPEDMMSGILRRFEAMAKKDK